MIIRARAAAGASTARMISRERFACDLEESSQLGGLRLSLALTSVNRLSHCCRAPAFQAGMEVWGGELRRN